MDGSSNQALAAQYYWWKAKMGIDIEVYAEKRENGKWVFFMPKENFSKSGCGYCRPLDTGGRVPVWSQTLSQLYDKGYEDNYKMIFYNRGVPMDACEEIKSYMEDLVNCSYVLLREILDFCEGIKFYTIDQVVSLREILSFDGNPDSRMYGIYTEIAKNEFFGVVVKHMQTAISENISEDDIRIVFGYSS